MKRKERQRTSKSKREMESVLRTMKKMTGKSEEELRKEMKQELEELEKEVSAMKELLKTKPTQLALMQRPKDSSRQQVRTFLILYLIILCSLMFIISIQNCLINSRMNTMDIRISIHKDSLNGLQNMESTKDGSWRKAEITKVDI